MNQRAQAAKKSRARPLTRSETMARVRSCDTTPERKVRQVLTKLGYRYRLHRKDLPGNPDIAFIGRRKAIFVHGCFWHGHDCKRGARTPKENADYWMAKIARNRLRDETVRGRLTTDGWGILTVWECELRDPPRLAIRLKDWLELAPG